MLFWNTAFIYLWIFCLQYPAVASSEQSDTIYPGSDRVDTIRTAYEELGQRVRTTLQTQRGDYARLEAQFRSASHFLDVVEQVCLNNV
jgi:hypothetical protein